MRSGPFWPSLRIGIVTVWLVWPSAKLTTWRTGMKSTLARGRAGVAVRTTVAAPSLPPSRVIVTVAEPASWRTA